MAGHNFNNNTFIIIEQIKYGLLPKLRIHNLLEHRKDFGFPNNTPFPATNISLKYPQNTTGSIW